MMSRQSNRLLGKRKQPSAEGVEDPTSYGKRRKKSVIHTNRKRMNESSSEELHCQSSSSSTYEPTLRFSSSIQHDIIEEEDDDCLDDSINIDNTTLDYEEQFVDAVEDLNAQSARHNTTDDAFRNDDAYDDTRFDALSTSFRPVDSPLNLHGESIFKRRDIPFPIPQFVSRQNPLPCFKWADSEDVWRAMERKERLPKFHKDVNLIGRHSGMEPRMRSILVDWLIEVAEVYKMHRETLYLSVDYIDRYLSNTTSVKKTQLQLIGVTALFVAAKTEEVYPAHLTEFAYVTDGACTEEEILEQELILLKVLQWDMTSLTPLFWFGVYLQTLFHHQSGSDQCYLQFRFSPLTFVQNIRLLDLVILDVGCAQFSSSILAAAVMYHISNERLALFLSGYKMADIEPCVRWMEPFAVVVRDLRRVEIKHFDNIPSEDFHNIQTHIVDLDLLDLVYSQRSRNTSLSSVNIQPGCPTPPSSLKKACDEICTTDPIPMVKYKVDR